MWMLLMLLTPVCLAGISILVYATDGPNEPTVEPIVTPAGYYGVTDADFGYAVPNAYQQNTTWTDQNGDFMYGGAGAFVAETELIAKTSPTATSPPPPSLAVFGQAAPVPYTLHGGHRVSVRGTAFAYEATMTRPGGYHAVVIDTWEASSSTQMWLVIRAPADVTHNVITSLQG
jgi:hypothetical protein